LYSFVVHFCSAAGLLSKYCLPTQEVRLFCREHESLPLSMQYFLLSQSKVEQCVQQFDVNRRHEVVLMVMADQPEKEIAARDSLLKAQQTDLPSRRQALHKAVADLKVLCVDT
jgi:hypothetical protein